MLTNPHGNNQTYKKYMCLIILNPLLKDEQGKDKNRESQKGNK